MNEISWSQFEEVEMRAGTIIEVHDFPAARKPAYQVKIDFGDYGIRKSSAQITDLYSKEDLNGKQVIAVCNFPPKQIANFMSECLILGVVGSESGVVLLSTERPVKNGQRIA